MPSRTVTIIMATMWLGLGLLFVTASSGRAGDDTTAVAGSMSGSMPSGDPSVADAASSTISTETDVQPAITSPDTSTAVIDQSASSAPSADSAAGYGADGSGDPQP
jgi:hypothetical protein